MNNRSRAIKKICWKILKNDKAEKLMHDDNNKTWFRGTIGCIQFEFIHDETEWGKRIYKLLGIE